MQEEKEPTKSATIINSNSNGNGQEQINVSSMTRKNKLSITSAAKENIPITNTVGVV